MVEISKKNIQEEINKALKNIARMKNEADKIKKVLDRNLKKIRNGVAEIEEVLDENNKTKKKVDEIEEVLDRNLKKIRRLKKAAVIIKK